MDTLPIALPLLRVLAVSYECWTWSTSGVHHWLPVTLALLESLAVAEIPTTHPPQCTSRGCIAAPGSNCSILDAVVKSHGNTGRRRRLDGAYPGGGAG